MRLTTVNHLLASCYNDNKYSLLIGHTDGRGGFNRPHRQLAVRNKPRAGGVKMCQGQNVSFPFSNDKLGRNTEGRAGEHSAKERKGLGR